MRIKPLFAPRHGPEMEIMKQMLKAQETNAAAETAQRQVAAYALDEINHHH
jgi:hypothetical protein